MKVTAHEITWGIVYWPVFLIATSLFFLGPESFAFFTNHFNTLSDYAWYQLGMNGPHWHHTLARFLSLIAWLVFVAVITGHIWFKVPD